MSKSEDQVGSFSEDSYQALLKEGLTEEELEAAIKQKKSEFGGVLNTDGMLFIIAREHGIMLPPPETEQDF